MVPFQQIASLADVVRTQTIESCLQLLLIIAVDAQGFGSLDGVLEELADDGKVGGTAIKTAATVALIGDVVSLWRCARGGNQLVGVVWIRYEPRKQEVGCTFHQRVGGGAKIFCIAGIVVVIPKGFYEPGSTHRPVAPLWTLVSGSHRIAHRPGICIVSGAPSLIDAIEVLGIVSACHRHAFNQSVYWGHQFWEVGDFCRPVILFQVDVDGIVAAPWRIEGWCPESLQVGWHALGSTAADEQVSAILEIELFQVRIALVVVAVGEQLSVGRAGGIKLGSFQAQAYSIKEFLIVSDVALLEFIVCKVGEMPGIIGYVLDVWSSFLYGMLVEAVVTCFVDEIDDSLAYILQMEGRITCPHLSVGVLYLKHGTVMRTVGFISENMSRHGELSSGCFHLMGNEGGEGDVAVDGSLLGSTQLDGNHLVGMRSKILFVILLEQRLSDFRNPLVGFSTFVGIHGHARPKGNVVELDGVVVGSTVNQRTQFAIA